MVISSSNVVQERVRLCTEPTAIECLILSTKKAQSVRQTLETGARKKPLAFVQNYVSTYPLAAEPRVSSIRGGMSDDCWPQSAMQRYERTKEGSPLVPAKYAPRYTESGVRGATGFRDSWRSEVEIFQLPAFLNFQLRKLASSRAPNK